MPQPQAPDPECGGTFSSPSERSRSEQTPAFNICLPCGPEKALGWRKIVQGSKFLTEPGHSGVCPGMSRVHLGQSSTRFPFLN